MKQGMIILAGGSGTRLKPITDSYHKSLVPIHGVPNIEHTIEVFSSLDRIYVITSSVDYDKFLYLNDKYDNVVVVDNPGGKISGTMTSLRLGLQHAVKDNISKVFITEGDVYFISRPDTNYDSVFFLTYRINEWRIEVVGSKVVGLSIDKTGYCESGLCLMSRNLYTELLFKLDKFYDLRMTDLFWEQILFTDEKLYSQMNAVILNNYFSKEYDTPEELKELVGDKEYDVLMEGVCN